MNDYLNCFLALIALINPVSKIFVIHTLSKDSPFSEIRQVIIKASFIAMMILMTFALIGNVLLTHVFHVDIFSFQIVGGLVLLWLLLLLSFNFVKDRKALSFLILTSCLCY